MTIPNKNQNGSGYKQPGEPLYTKKEAAVYLKVSQRTVDRLRSRLDLVTHKVGNQVRIPESSLLQMLGKGTMTQAERNSLIQHELYGDI